MHNPFKPSFGVTPEIVTGRDSIIAQIGMALAEGPGSPYRFTLISGARGTGKTVLLNLIENQAKSIGWKVARIPASKDMLPELKDVILPRILREGSKDSSSIQVTGASVAGIGSLNFHKEDHFPQGHSLRSLLHTVAKLLNDQGSGLFLSLDELQSASLEDLHLLTDAIQNAVRDDLPVALAVAGLPFEIAELLDHPGTTFLRRAVPITIGSLTKSETAELLSSTASIGEKEFSSDGLQQAVDLIQGYPFLVQLLGSISFTLAPDRVIDLSNVESAIPLAIERMGLQVHAPALRNIPDREREYLEALANEGSPAKTEKIAERMDIPMNQQSTYRRRLIERGLIVRHSQGMVSFSLPFMGEYLLNSVE